MELKVWVEGIQRIVCGVTEATTCQDVVFALAHATNKIGRFTLIERWRNNERHLAPNENPLKILMKWGEYSSDVQFILQQSDPKPAAVAAAAATPASPPNTAHQHTSPTQPNSQISRQPPIEQTTTTPTAMITNDESKPTMTIIHQQQQQQQQRSLPGKVVDLNNLDTYQVDKMEQQKKPLVMLDFKENIVGVVRGVPQQKQNESPLMQHAKPAGFVLPHMKQQTIMTTTTGGSSPAQSSHSPQSSIDSNNFQPPPPKKTNNSNFNSMDVRNSLDRVGQQPATITTTVHATPSGDAIIVPNRRPNSPIISNNGALVPPPYRDPPPPTNATTATSNGSSLNNSRHSEDAAMELESANSGITANQYRDLVQLIKLQRDQLSVQQIDMTRLDQEIEMLEQRDREHALQMEALAREILEQDQMLRQGADQLQGLQYVEEESELVKQQERTLQSEITLLRSKLANCETELLQCRNKVKLLVDDIQLEQRAMQFENRSHMEAQILGEMERLQGDIEQIVKKSEGTISATSTLKHDISFIEGAIADKKKQVEQLVHEMKEVNLQSLSVAPPSEEVRHLLEGSQRPGSTRRIIGSPRQLENAVPTSKNPHGVWV